MPICQQPPPACIAGRQAGTGERGTGRDREGDRERYRTNSELEGVAHEDGKGLKVRVP